MAFLQTHSICTTGFGTGCLRVADLNGDCIPELLLSQNYPRNQEISCITAMDLNGRILWQHGQPGVGGGQNYGDLPVGIIDWDGDGQNEVLYIRQAVYKVPLTRFYDTGELVRYENPDLNVIRWDYNTSTERAAEYEGDAHLFVLDGATGAVKEEMAIPAPADDCIAFGYFDGTGKPNLLVKDRYWNMWALNHEGEILWHFNASETNSTLGHYPAVGDIDGDGLDEVFITDTLIDSDGTRLWKIEEILEHNDSAVMLDDAQERRIISASDEIRCLSADGKVLWKTNGGHWQQVIAGHFSTDPKHGPYQFVGRDINPEGPGFSHNENGRTGHLPGQRITLFDWNGNVLWTHESHDREYYIRTIRWQGDHDCIAFSPNLPAPGSAEEKVVFSNITAMILDGTTGEVSEQLPCPEGKLVDGGGLCTADILGDSRDELLLYTADQILVFSNSTPPNQRRHANFTLFNGE